MTFLRRFFSLTDSSSVSGEEVECADTSSSLINTWRTHSQAPDWRDFYAPDIFIEWARELKIAVALQDKAAWDLAGRGVLLVSEQQATAVDLCNKIASDAGLNFFEVPASHVTDLVPDIRAKFHEHAPALVFLEPGDWMASNPDPTVFSPFDDHDTAFSKSLRSDLLSFDPKYPVVVVTAANSERLMCRELKKVGAFDRIFTTDQPNAEFLGAKFVAKVGHEFFDAQTLNHSLKKIGLLLQSEFEESDQQDLLVLRIKRFAKSEARKINFNDLANFALRGVVEHARPDPSITDAASKRKTAIHEAGHACIAIIASEGQNIPDYATVVPSKNFMGVVFESLAYYDKMEDFTFNNMLLKTRICLAGRAAEDLFFGSSNVSSGANSDLAAVSRMCFSLFAYSGFHPEMMTADVASSNLAVLRSGEVDPIQYDRISKEVRHFLHEQYHHVIQTLENNKGFVEAVAERLLWDPIVDQSEMIEIAVRFGIKVG